MDLNALERMTKDDGKVLKTERLPKLDVGTKHKFRSEERRIYVPAYGDGLDASSETAIACSCGWEYKERRFDSDETKRRLAIAEHQIAVLKAPKGRKAKLVD